MDRTFKELKQVPSGSQLLHQNSAKRFKTYVLKRFLFYICSSGLIQGSVSKVGDYAKIWDNLKRKKGISNKSWGLRKNLG